MNTEALKIAALKLEEALVLIKENDQTANTLYIQLEKLIKAAITESILQNMEPRDVPGHRLFDESHLQNNKNLRTAYSNFYIELIGGCEWEVFKMLQKAMIDCG